jgi:hypothetical protein
MSLTGYEQETIINYNKEEAEADIYTHDEKLIKKLKQACKVHPEKFKQIDKNGEAYTFTIHKKYITVKIPKVLTEEERQKLRERALNMANKNK